MRGRPADDKQKPNGGMIRKQFIVFPVVSPLSPDPLYVGHITGARWIWGQGRRTNGPLNNAAGTLAIKLWK